MTSPTDIPVNLDGTYNEPTWAEGAGAISVPPAENLGLGAVALPFDTVNYEWRQLSRWIRAMAITRMVPSDAGLYGSFLTPASGTWNVAGGTLNGTLGPSWVLVDADDDGGIMVQFNVPLGSPHAFTASKDTYVNLAEDGTAEYQEVANGGSPPSPSAGYVAIWKVVTDGTEITAATVRVPAIPVFKTIGAEKVNVLGQLEVGTDASVGGDLDVTGTSSLDGDVNLSTGTGSFTTTIGTSSADTLTVPATTSLTSDVNLATGTGAFTTTIGTSSADTLTVPATVSVTGPTTLGDNVNLGTAAGAKTVTIGADSSDIATVNATVTTIAPVTMEEKFRHRSHAAGATWVTGTYTHEVSDATSGVVPGGGGNIAVFTLTHLTTPTRSQILAPSGCVLVLDLSVTVSDVAGSNIRTLKITTSWKRTGGGSMTLGGDNSANGLDFTAGSALATVGVSGGEIAVTCGGSVGIAGTTLRAAFTAVGHVMLLT